MGWFKVMGRGRSLGCAWVPGERSRSGEAQASRSRVIT